MSGSSFGQMFRLTTFGESHGPAIGGVIDGCPPGIPLSEETIQQELDRRKPGAGIASTARKESDRISLLSGVFEGVTTGTAIGFSIANEDQRSRDYSQVKDVYRPGHADLTYDA
ncbi:chorismate synthase, partial [Desulfocurvibacter africanus]